MSQPLPARIDPFQLADKGASLAGTLAADALPRLRAAVLSLEETDAALDFARDDAQRCVIRGTASASVTMSCQRCLEPVRLTLQAAFHDAVVRDEAAAEGLPEELEPIVAGHSLAPAEVIEDELLLVLPIVPRHEDSVACGPRAKVLERQKKAEQKQPNPFAVLKNLKQHN